MMPDRYAIRLVFPDAAFSLILKFAASQREADEEDALISISLENLLRLSTLAYILFML